MSVTADYYSLGATACFVLTGKVPNLLPEEPATRTGEDRLAAWLGACGPAGPPEAVAEMITGLMKDEPAARWNTRRAREALRGPDTARPTRTTPARDEDLDRAVAGLVNHLLDTVTPEDDRRLWPVSTAAGETNACTVQQGAAGPLAVLTRYFELTADPRLPEVLSAAGHWIADRTHLRTTRPGLHFGDPGTAWALYEAGRALSDQPLIDHALALALTPQEPTLHHDITHGTAGSGMAALHLWQRTGDPRLAALAEDAADRLAAAARRGPSAVSWPVPAEAVSGEAGKQYLGFAHGSAGIGCFLLCGAVASGRQDHLRLAVEVGEHLLRSAVRIGEAVQWPAQAGDEPTAPYWCHGSAGIGTFLVRLRQVTGDDRFGDLARRSAAAVAERASRAPLSQCHGLAGNGDFLLDLSAATGSPPTTPWPTRWAASPSPKAPAATGTWSSPTSTATSRPAGATDRPESWPSSSGFATRAPGTGSPSCRAERQRTCRRTKEEGENHGKPDPGPRTPRPPPRPARDRPRRRRRGGLLRHV